MFNHTSYFILHTSKVFICFLALFSLTLQARGDSLIVFAASSMTDVIKENCRSFEKATGIKVKLNLSSSGKLARQIEAGAPADLFISASKKWAEYTSTQGLLETATVKPFLSNSLVVIAPQDSNVKPFTISKDLDFPSLFRGRLSVGDPNFVPAGSYAMEALKFCNCDNSFKKRLLPGADVRSALMMVEMGEVEMGVVYKTDAMKSEKVKILSEFPVESHSQIVYYYGISKEAKAEARQLYDWLTNSKSTEFYKKSGFKPINKWATNHTNHTKK